jgi:hypothetical protein
MVGAYKGDAMTAAPRFHLAVMQPSTYVHSLGFLDPARYVRYQLRRLGLEVSIGKNRLREDAVNIVFGAHLGFQHELKDKYPCLIFNLEQTGPGGASLSEDYLSVPVERIGALRSLMTVVDGRVVHAAAPFVGVGP